MLEDFVAPSTAQRLRSCILGSYLDTFSAGLFDLGHKLSTIRSKLWVVSDLTRWMCKKRLAVVDLDERRIDEYLEARRRRGPRLPRFRLDRAAAPRWATFRWHGPPGDGDACRLASGRPAGSL